MPGTPVPLGMTTLGGSQYYANVSLLTLEVETLATEGSSGLGAVAEGMLDLFESAAFSFGYEIIRK
jgi:hypothetical protein